MAVFAAGDAIGRYGRARELLLEDPPWGVAAARGEGVPGRLRLYGGLARASAMVHDLAQAQEAYEEMLSVAQEAGVSETADSVGTPQSFWTRLLEHHRGRRVVLELAEGFWRVRNGRRCHGAEAPQG